MRIALAVLTLAAALLAPMPAPAGECCAYKNGETSCLPCRPGRGA
jgi:hypothetical protein